MADINGTITALAPPPGYSVDFTNPQRRLLTEAYIVSVVGNLLAVAFLLQRLYTKICLMAMFQAEDGIITVAWVLSLATQATLLFGWQQGVVGVHAWEISLDAYGLYARLLFSIPFVYVPCTACTKIVLCLFYSRLSPSRVFQITVWATLFVIVGAYTGIVFGILFVCHPIAASWDPTLLATAVCINGRAIYIAAAVIGIVTDVLLFALPIPTIWKLQMPRKQKAGLIAMFGVGSITVVTSIMRLVVLIPALPSLDQPWVISQGCLWIFVESNLQIICCCLPTLRRFFGKIAPHFIGERSSNPMSRETNSYQLRTWGRTNGRPRRRFDTLMNTIEHDEPGNNSFATEENGKGLSPRESRVNVNEINTDNNSEEAILHEHTVQATFKGAEDLTVSNMPTSGRYNMRRWNVQPASDTDVVS